MKSNLNQEITDPRMWLLAGNLLHEHTDNNACAVIIKHPIGDVERRVNHLGEYHE